MREEVIAFAKQYHARHGKPPSVRTLEQSFRAQGLNRYSFYSEFPGGMGELCRLAGIPATGSIEQTVAATESRRAASRDTSRAAAGVNLTENQERRLLAICHLEGGKDPSLVLDEILYRDMKFRKLYKLSMPDTARVAGYLDEATKRGWSIHDSPSILDCLTEAWNAGVIALEPALVTSLTELAREIQRRGSTPKQYLNLVARTQNMVSAYLEYKSGGDYTG
ncbi:MAG: hypothetical protein ABR867_03065 [Nitrososphaerales archaeon]|jgi:hypothetical protein